MEHPAPNGAVCNDGNSCTENDICGNGVCTGEPLKCDDGDYCNGEETCQLVVGCVQGEAVPVDDGIGCTVDECDSETKTITHKASDELCDDGLFCNGSEKCDPEKGCQAVLAPDSDDSIACTVDACDEGADEVTHVADDELCSAADGCAFGTCDVEKGCVLSFLEGSCNDGNPCTTNDAKKAAGLRHFTFHDLRRAVADRHRLAGTPMDRYCKYMGHSPITALRHYTVVDPDDLHHDLHAALDATRTRKGKRGRLVKDDDPEVADD